MGIPGMPREGLRRKWSKSPSQREEEGRAGRGNLWYNKARGGGRAFEINSASDRTKRRVRIQGVVTL